MQTLNHYIEHTNLNPLLTSAQVEELVEQAVANSFLGVCVPPFWVKKAKRDIGKNPIRLVTVIGFPLGYNRTETKIEELSIAIRDGADELDLVMNLSALKSDAPHWCKAEFARCAKIAHDHEKILKVIIETAHLQDTEIVLACKMCEDAGVDFVKTSTGFAPAGAKVEHIRLMRQNLRSDVGIKASGGIKTLTQAFAMIEAGADRLGTSASLQLMREYQDFLHLQQ